MAQSRDKALYRVWLGALACFVLAGSTGSLLRFGMRLGYPAGLQMANIRHAHSHLMYFGWATPALMALIISWLPVQPSRRMKQLLWAILIASVAAYVPFLLYGYQVAEIGGLTLPLSTMMAGLNVVLWYGFVLAYRQATRGLPCLLWLRLWDAAAGFLVLASLGAWGLAGAGLLHIDEPVLAFAFSHLFLDLFADGWFVLALLGLAYIAMPQAAGKRAARWGEALVIAGLPLTFLLSLPAGAIPVTVRWVAAAAGLLVGAGLIAHLAALVPVAWRGGREWLVPLAFLGLKAAGELAISFPAGASWAATKALRIPYLHWLLLGFATLGLVAAAAQRWGDRAVPARHWLLLTVLILEVSLIPLTLLWPSAWRGVWTLDFAAWATLGPVLVALAILLLPKRGRVARVDTDPAFEV